MTKITYEAQRRKKQAKHHHYTNCGASLDLDLQPSINISNPLNDHQAQRMNQTNIQETEISADQVNMNQPNGSEPVTTDTQDQSTTSTDSQRPNIEELEVQSEDDEDTDPFVDAAENTQEPIFKIVINPTGETYTGTSEEATLLKWHYHVGHINM